MALKIAKTINNKCDYCGSKLTRGYIKLTDLTAITKPEEFVKEFKGILCFCDEVCLGLFTRERGKWVEK